MKKSPEELLRLLTARAVLLPVTSGTKYPITKGWSKLTFEQTQTPPFQKKLNSCGNTGVLLGEPSQHLITIDFDDADAQAKFEQENPHLLHTLRTKGSRGENFWLIIEGDYPKKTQHLTDAQGNRLGEWRASGGQTIIQGVHPSGCEYSYVVESPPMRVKFNSINWGEISNFDEVCHVDNVDKVDDTDYSDNSEECKRKKIETPLSFSDKILATEEAEKELLADPLHKDYYHKYIETKISKAEGTRNSQMVACVTFLSNALGDKVTMKLMEYFWRLNQDLFHDPLEQHMKETQHQLDGVKSTFLKSLSADEKEKYTLFTGCERQQSAFRICRHLASKSEDRTFFLSMGEIGRRLGKESKAGERILLQLSGAGVIKLVKKGKKRMKGQGGIASTYQYLLS